MSPEGLGRRALLLVPLYLAACGFAPAYAPGGSGDRLRGRVTLAAPETPDGFRLLAQLEDRLGPSDSGPLVLTAEVEVDTISAAITPDGAITRYDLRGRAPWRLSGSDGTVLGEGVASGFTGYSATGTAVATRAAEEDARDRLMVLLADEIVARLLLLRPEALS